MQAAMRGQTALQVRIAETAGRRCGLMSMTRPSASRRRTSCGAGCAHSIQGRCIHWINGVSKLPHARWFDQIHLKFPCVSLLNYAQDIQSKCPEA